MTPTTLSAAVAAERVRDMERAAGDSRLAALARCCRTSQLRRAAVKSAAAARAMLRRLTGRPHTIVCCP